jgi:hypothetical protein
MRGYGQSDRPEAIDQYTLLHIVDDIVGSLMRSVFNKRSSLDTTGVRRSRGTQLCCAPTASVT